MVEIFFSYSHTDEGLRNELGKHLAALERQGFISSWHDRQIIGRQDIDREIDAHLEGADIILFLVSPDFIASEYCYNREVKRALERHDKGEAVILPVILRPCDWHDLPFGKLLAVPKDGKAVTKFSNIDDAFLDIVLEIKRIIKESGAQHEMTEIGYGRKPEADIPTDTAPRSSNLRVRKDFSDKENNDFLDLAFEYISNYFESSLAELERRNPQLDTKFRRVDVYRFFAKIYIDGNEVSQCNIWLANSSNHFSTGIFYSTGSFSDRSYNESMSVKNNGYVQYLKPMGMSFISADEERLTFEGAAEYFWKMLLRNLQ